MIMPLSLRCRGAMLFHNARNVVPAIQTTQFDVATLDERKEQAQDAAFERMRGLGLQAATKFFMHPFDHVRRADTFPLRAREPQEREQLGPRLREAARHR